MTEMILGLAALFGADQIVKAVIEKKFKLLPSAVSEKERQDALKNIEKCCDSQDASVGADDDSSLKSIIKAKLFKQVDTGKDNAAKQVDEEKPVYKDIFKGRLRLRRLHNSGIFCSCFSGHSEAVKYVSMGATIAILAHFVVYMFHKEPSGFKWAFTFILSGALSNLVDRVRHGYVIDYFSVNSNRKRKKVLVYNLGDAFIFLGAVIAVFTVLITSGKQ